MSEERKERGEQRTSDVGHRGSWMVSRRVLGRRGGKAHWNRTTEGRRSRSSERALAADQASGLRARRQARSRARCRHAARSKSAESHLKYTIRALGGWNVLGE
jgi:hypothetical protein